MISQMPSEAARLDAQLDAALHFGPQVLRGGLSAGAEPPLHLGLGSDDGDQDLGGDDADSNPEVDTADTETNTDADEESVLEAETGIEGTPRSASLNGQSDNIRVFVRVRPPNSREGSAPSRDIVRVDAGAGIMHLLAEPPRSFAFDGVLGESSTQSEVFDLMGSSVGDACLSGYNGSIYVYGQTGSGKTHTMQGPVASVQSMHADERRGIMCRLLDHIFGEIAKRHQAGGSVQYSCKCSYLEIYKEQITDLLEPSSTNLQVREDINRGIYVERLSEHSVWTVSDAFYVLWKGLHQRHVAATQMNELSSRSHSVFTLRLEATSTTQGGVTSTKIARLNLIDLAGSERQSFDPHNPTHDGLRVKEAGAINKSLSALTNVIMSLSQNAGQRRRKSIGSNSAERRPFVRYRDSKLTFLLRDSLGGNSKTVIVACVSPSALCFGETLSTLKFAARAKHIRCAAVMNEEYSGTVESLMLEVKSLKQQLDLLSSRGLMPSALGCASQASLVAESMTRSLCLGPQGLGEDPVEKLLAGSSEELQRLCGQKRAMRLEILLGGALERERRCELQRHKLDKFTQYLNNMLERKEHYFDALRDYFSFLVDKAAGEAWYMPELTARLVVFRKQLYRMATDSDSRQHAADMLDGATEALAADDGDLDEGHLDNSTLSSHMQDFDASQRSVGDSPVPRSRSYSYGLLMGKEARKSRRSIAQFQQLRSSSNRLLQGGSYADGFAAPAASAPSLAAAPLQVSPPAVGGGLGFGGGLSISTTAGGPGDEALAALRAENRLLRRQLEKHPELHRLSAENRLLRENLAALVKQRGAVRQDPPWPRGHKHSRRAHDGAPESHSGECGRGRGAPQPAPVSPEKPAPAPGIKEDSPGMSREKSLTRNAKSCRFVPLQQLEEAGAGRTGSQPFPRFPGTEDATQISDTSSSGGSDSEDADEALAPARSAGAGTSVEDDAAASAAKFLPNMAQNVEELFRTKASLEDSIEQLLRRRQAASGAMEFGMFGDRLPNGVGMMEVDPRAAGEILRGTSEALKVAQGIIAKEAMWLAPGGQSEDVAAPAGPPGAWSMPRHIHEEGLDEHHVVLSLMRSLPTESPSLSRQGCASSAPHLPPGRLGPGLLGSGGASLGGLGGLGMGGNPGGLGTQTLRASSSTGTAGARMQRNRSTTHLQRINEMPSPLGGASPLKAGFAASLASPEPEVAAEVASPEVPAGDLSGASSADMLGDAAQKARDLCGHLERVGEAYRDMQEQLKPLREEYLRTLEEGKFLEAQYRRLDVHCRLLEERTRSLGGLSARSQVGSGKEGGGKPGVGPWQMPGLSSGTPMVAPQGMLRGCPGSPGGKMTHAADVGSPPQMQPRRSSSAASLSPNAVAMVRQQPLHSAGAALAPPMWQSPCELAAGCRAAGTAAPPSQRLSEEFMRRVSSAPQLPAGRPEMATAAGALQGAQPPAAAALQQTALQSPGRGAQRTLGDNQQLDFSAASGSIPLTVWQPGAKAAAEHPAAPGHGGGALQHQGSSGALVGHSLGKSGSVATMANKELLLMDSLSGLGKRLGASFASGGVSSQPQTSEPMAVQPSRADLLSISASQSSGVGLPTSGARLPLRQSAGKVGAAAAAARAAGWQASSGQMGMPRS